MDRRIIKTKEAIKKTYKNLLMEKSNSRITITELAKKANIDRKTFYLHYDTIDAISQEIIKDNLSELERVLRENGFSEEHFDISTIIRSMNSCIIKDIDFYNAICHRSDFNLFLKEMKDIFTIRTLNTLCQNSDISEKEASIYCQFIISGITDVYAEWFCNKDTMSLDELGDILGNIMNQGIHILYKKP